MKLRWTDEWDVMSVYSIVLDDNDDGYGILGDDGRKYQTV
jgi:hypothetical protein